MLRHSRPRNVHQRLTNLSFEVEARVLSAQQDKLMRAAKVDGSCKRAGVLPSIEVADTTALLWNLRSASGFAASVRAHEGSERAVPSGFFQKAAVGDFLGQGSLRPSG